DAPQSTNVVAQVVYEAAPVDNGTTSTITDVLVNLGPILKVEVIPQPQGNPASVQWSGTLTGSNANSVTPSSIQSGLLFFGVYNAITPGNSQSIGDTTFFKPCIATISWEFNEP